MENWDSRSASQSRTTAAAAAIATLDLVCEPGFYARLNARAEAFYREMQVVIDRHGLAKQGPRQFLVAAPLGGICPGGGIVGRGPGGP